MRHYAQEPKLEILEKVRVNLYVNLKEESYCQEARNQTTNIKRQLHYHSSSKCDLGNHLILP